MSPNTPTPEALQQAQDIAVEEKARDAIDRLHKTIEETGTFEFTMPCPEEFENSARTQMEDTLRRVRAHGIEIPDVTCRTKYRATARNFRVTVHGPKDQLHLLLGAMFPSHQPVMMTMQALTTDGD